MAGRAARGHSRSTSPERPNAPETGYLVRTAVKALIKRGNRVLFVKERHDSGKPFWTLPGGGLKTMETPRSALARELQEEIDAKTDIGDFLGGCPYVHRSREHVVSMYWVFEANLLSDPRPNPAEGIETMTFARPATPPNGLLSIFRARLPDLIARG